MKTLGDFAARAEPLLARLARGDAAAIAACAMLLEEFAASGVIPDLLRDELAAIARDPTHTPARSASTHLWVLWGSTRGARVAVSRIHAGIRDDSDYLADATSHRFLTPIDGAPIDVALYTQNAAQDDEVMSSDDALTPAGNATIDPGKARAIRPRRDVVDVPAQARSRYLLSFEGPRVVTQQWIYDKETKKPVFSVAADPHDARLEGAMRMLSVLGHREALSTVAALATHPAHFVRWTAIRHAAAFDRETGVRLLVAAADDPHVHVRNAARRALERLG